MTTLKTGKIYTIPELVPSSTGYCNVLSNVKNTIFSIISGREEEICKLLSSYIFVRINNWDRVIAMDSCKYQRVYERKFCYRTDALHYDAMHVQLLFNTSKELQLSLNTVLDYTSQRAEEP